MKVEQNLRQARLICIFPQIIISVHILVPFFELHNNKNVLSSIERHVRSCPAGADSRDTVIINKSTQE